MKKTLLVCLIISIAAIAYAADYSGTTSNAELDFVTGVTSAIQDQLDALTTKWTNLGATHDTSGELDALYEAELDNLAGLAAALSDEGAYMPTLLGFADVAALGDALWADLAAGDIPDISATYLSATGNISLGGDLDLNGHDITGVGVLAPDGYSSSGLEGDPDSWTLTAALHYGGHLIATAAGEDTLNEAVVGMSLTLEARDTIAAIYNPYAGDTIYRNGVALAASEALISDATAGTFSQCACDVTTVNEWNCSCTDGMTEETP